MLVYPRYDRPFHLYPDACDVQIGEFLLQDDKTLGCYSKKLNNAQKKYPITDKELLAIDCGLKYFNTIVRGARIKVYCDHKNLTFGADTVHTSQRVLR